MSRFKPPQCYLPVILLVFTLFIFNNISGQVPRPGVNPKGASGFALTQPKVPYLPEEKDNQLFGMGNRYIENIGQYGNIVEGWGTLGSIKYGYEGWGMPALFTTKGVIFLQRKINKLTEEQREEAEKSGALNGKTEEGLYYSDRRIGMEWINANPAVTIIAEEAGSNYYVYASVNAKAKGFKRIIYKDMYPGIDVVYSFARKERSGFEYSLVVKPGADISRIQLKFSGDIQELKKDVNGDLLFFSDIDGFRQSAPVAFYCSGDNCGTENPGGLQKIPSRFDVKDQTIRFDFPEGYDKSRTIVIDPFVSSTATLTGSNNGIAKDIDFDYSGNIYVTGGGSTMFNLLAKYNSSGSLLWTFNGTLTSPSWAFGVNYGGWVVEKTTGKTYLGQGGTSGFQIVRLSADGVYDNYITTQDPAFQENWKMIWNCDGGTPKILIAGGGSANQPINLGICTPPSTSLTQVNITGQPTGHQDIADLVLDPKTNELYTIFAQNFVTPITENNRIYKHRSPYNTSAMVWNRLSGFPVLSERANRPYLADASGFNDNSINGLAVNSRYFFYYDGLNLVAMDKNTGVTMSAPTSFLPNIVLQQGGVVADECNNVYIGSVSGTIKVFKFDGTFNDGAAPDIRISGFPSASVYDLAYDNAKNLLYASGQGFVASIDINSYCAAAIYTVAVAPDCVSRSAIGTLTPTLPTGSTVTFELYEGNTLVASNTTGSFQGLQLDRNYTMKALVDQACGGTQAVKDFMIANCNAPGVIPGIYVPTGFTPNGDGLNDVLKVVAVGIREFKYLEIYNRWGELVFRTTDPAKGWNGQVNGKNQDTGVFVWMTEGIGFDDKPIKLKGTLTLIR